MVIAVAVAARFRHHLAPEKEKSFSKAQEMFFLQIMEKLSGVVIDLEVYLKMFCIRQKSNQMPLICSHTYVS